MEKKRAFTAKPAEKALCTAYRLLQFSKGLSQFLHIPISDNRQKPPELFLRQIPPPHGLQQFYGILIIPFTDWFRRNASHNRVRLHIFGNDGSRSDDRPVPYADTGKYDRLITYPDIIAYYNITLIIPRFCNLRYG